MKDFECDICDESYYDYTLLLWHKIMQHWEENNDRQTDPATELIADGNLNPYKAEPLAERFEKIRIE